SQSGSEKGFDDSWADWNANEPAGGQTGRPETESLAEIVIEGIDTAAAMQHHSGSLDDYRELLQLYCLEGKRKLQLIKELFENQDYHDYEIEVHGLKSASANIGAMRLSAMAKEHEMAAGQSDADFVLAHFSELYEAYDEQLTHIQNYLDEAVQENEEPEAEELPKEELLRQIGEALGRLQKFRSHECADIVAELLRHRLPQDVKEQLSEIQEQLKLYEDDAAEQLLQQLLQKMES
ncbi:MAG: Hpt domain-containing protein, partial [Lachnospiraceae bacterium]|nr:Hpt domain-containing protein [Lachnospiraceae bacterium]